MVTQSDLGRDLSRVSEVLDRNLDLGIYSTIGLILWAGLFEDMYEHTDRND